MNHADEHTDLRIDQILHALATTTTPSGLEQRISARMAQHTAEEADRRTAAPFSITYLIGRTTPFAIGLAALTALAVVLSIFLTRSKPGSMANQPPPVLATPQSIATSQSIDVPRAIEVLRTPEGPTAHSMPAFGSVRLAVPGARPLSNRRAKGPAYTATTDPDAIALAETLAPSRPVSPLPLSTQEALLLRSTRRGQPIEVAELETRRQSALTMMASVRERNSLRDYIHGLLGPLATAQELTPPPSSPPPPPDDTQPAAEPQPPSSK